MLLLDQSLQCCLLEATDAKPPGSHGVCPPRGNQLNNLIKQGWNQEGNFIWAILLSTVLLGKQSPGTGVSARVDPNTILCN